MSSHRSVSRNVFIPVCATILFISCTSNEFSKPEELTASSEKRDGLATFTIDSKTSTIVGTDPDTTTNCLLNTAPSGSTIDISIASGSVGPAMAFRIPGYDPTKTDYTIPLTGSIGFAMLSHGAGQTYSDYDYSGTGQNPAYSCTIQELSIVSKKLSAKFSCSNMKMFNIRNEATKNGLAGTGNFYCYISTSENGLPPRPRPTPNTSPSVTPSGSPTPSSSATPSPTGTP